MTKVGIVVGSLREGSYAGQWAKIFEELLPSNYEVEYLDFSNLQVYTEDYDGNEPQEYLDYRDAVERQDAIIFVTPEYNRSIPGGLKNAIDVASRPYGYNKWAGKPALVASHSISNISGIAANHVLRQSLVFVDMPVLQQPEVYLANSPELLNDDGTVANPSTTEFLQSVVDAFDDLIKKHVG